MKHTKTFLITALLTLLFAPDLFAQAPILDLYYSGNYTQVIAESSRAISQGDTAYNTHYLKALSEAQLGQTAEAISTLEGAQELFKQRPGLLKMLAAQYYDAGYYVKAWNSYLQLTRRDSTDVSSWLKLADVASFRQQYDQAIQALETVLVLDSLNLSSLMMMGDILNRHNNSGAIVYYERAYRHYPDNQNAAYALGNLLIQAKKGWETLPICSATALSITG